MVIRQADSEETGGQLCIPQTQHAAISGQLARAWGNEAFPLPVPHEEVCLAAERHDDGMREFDSDPELDPDTGMPRDFMKMPLDSWLDCWERGPGLVAEDSPYAGLLVSLHGVHLLGYRDLERESDELRGRAEQWLGAQEALRGELAATLAGDERCSQFLDDEVVERARKLVSAWDAISLAVCVPRLPGRIADVPAESLDRELRMTSIGGPGGPLTVTVEPWPFSSHEVPLAAAGRRLRGRYEDREALREALAGASTETLAVTLVPA